MSQTEPTTPQDFSPVTMGEQLAEMVAPIRAALEQGEAKLFEITTAAEKSADEWKDRISAQRTENTKMRRALAVVDPSYTPPAAKKKTQPGRVGVPRTNGTATGHGISVESTEKFVDEILKTIDGGERFVTQKGIFSAIGEDQAKASSAFKYLREIGFLGKAGRDPETHRERWRVLDKDAYTKAVQAIRGDETVDDEPLDDESEQPEAVELVAVGAEEGAEG